MEQLYRDVESMFLLTLHCTALFFDLFLQLVITSRIPAAKLQRQIGSARGCTAADIRASACAFLLQRAARNVVISFVRDNGQYLCFRSDHDTMSPTQTPLVLQLSTCSTLPLLSLNSLPSLFFASA